jgi:hypothetical protein
MADRGAGGVRRRGVRGLTLGVALASCACAQILGFDQTLELDPGADGEDANALDGTEGDALEGDAGDAAFDATHDAGGDAEHDAGDAERDAGDAGHDAGDAGHDANADAPHPDAGPDAPPDAPANDGATTSANLSPLFRMGIDDQNLDGIGDSFDAAPFVSHTTTIERRSVCGFDLGPYAGRTLVSARVNGQIGPNNSFDTGDRVFAIELYRAAAAAAIADFSAPAMQVGTARLIAPLYTAVTFDIDATSAVTALRKMGQYVGLRVRSTTIDAPNVLESCGLDLVVF